MPTVWDRFSDPVDGSWDSISEPVQSKPAYQSLKEQNPGEYDPSSPAWQAKYGAAAVPWGENFSAGVGKSFVDTARGLRQLGASALDLFGGNRADEIRKEQDAVAAQDAPLMRSAGGIIGDIAGQAAQFAVPVGFAGRAATLGGNVARSAAMGAAMANTQPLATGQSRAASTALGAAGGAAGELLAAGIGRAATAASDRIDPAVKKLAERARELGIPLRAEQVSGSRPLAGVSAALDAVPFAGRDASRNAQRVGFNKAVAATLGEETANVQTAVRQAQNRLGGIYDNVLKSHPVKVDAEMLNGLDEVMQAARVELTDAQFGVMERQVNNILSKVGQGDAIDGQAAYNIKKMLDRIGKGSDTSLASHATDLKNELLSALDRSLPADVARQFGKAREQYRNLIAIRRIVKAGAEGNVSPAVLGNAKGLSKGLQEVADIGAQFLKEPFGNSGTANRLIGAGAIGGLGTGALFNPVLAAKVAATGATAGRGANAALDSGWLQSYLINGSPVLRKLLPLAQGSLPAAGTAIAVSGQ